MFQVAEPDVWPRVTLLKVAVVAPVESMVSVPEVAVKVIVSVDFVKTLLLSHEPATVKVELPEAAKVPLMVTSSATNCSEPVLFMVRVSPDKMSIMSLA